MLLCMNLLQTLHMKEEENKRLSQRLVLTFNRASLHHTLFVYFKANRSVKINTTRNIVQLNYLDSDMLHVRRNKIKKRTNPGTLICAALN